MANAASFTSGRPAGARRRGVQALAVALLCLAPAVQVLEGQSLVGRLLEIRKIYKTVKKTYDQFKTVTDILTWAGDVAAALEEEKAAPPPPSQWKKGARLLEILSEERDAIAAIELPVYEAPLPNGAAAPSSSFDAMRNSLQHRVPLLKVAVFELQDGDGARRELVGVADLAKVRGSAAARVAALLLQAAVRVPLPKLQLELVGAMFDISTIHIPVLQEIEDTARKGSSQMGKDIVARAKRVEAAAKDVRAVLAVEAAALSAEATRLKNAADALLARRQGLDRRKGAVKQEQIAIRALRNQAQQMLKEATSEDQTIPGLVSARDQAAAEITKEFDRQHQYFRCSAGYTWTRCQDHSDQKQAFDRTVGQSNYVTSRRQAIQNYNGLITQHQQRASSLRQGAAQKNSDAAVREQVLAKEISRLAYDEGVLQSDLQRDLEDRWKSRADLHFAANAGETQEIGEILAALAKLEQIP